MKTLKRRETIRKEKDIKNLVNEVFEDLKNNKKKIDTEDSLNKTQNSLLIKNKQNMKLSMTIEKGDMKNMLKAFQNRGNNKKSLYNSITVTDIFFTGVNKLNSMKYSGTLKRDASVV